MKLDGNKLRSLPVDECQNLLITVFSEALLKFTATESMTQKCEFSI